MANIKTKKIKNAIMNLLEKGPINLHELCYRMDAPADLLTGALQSLWSKGEIHVERKSEKELPSGETVIITKNAEPGITEVVDSRFVAACVSLTRARMRNEAMRKVKDTLSDGIPRTREELSDKVSISRFNLESVPDVVVLPDNKYTLRTVEAGKAELERRERDRIMKEEKVRKQKEVLDSLMGSDEAISEDKLKEILGEPVMPELTRNFVLLTGGKYALPDSPAALDDIASYLSRREPVSSKRFVKMFKPHKKLVSSIRKGKEIPPFIILPDGRVTVENYGAGQRELLRREMLVDVRNRLKDLIKKHAFFTLDDFSKEEKVLVTGETTEEGYAWFEHKGRTFLCSPFKHAPKRIARELKSITGLDFPIYGRATIPVAYLVENSLTPGEVAKRLAIRTNEAIKLYHSGYLPGFILEGSIRIWPNSLKYMNQGAGLEKILKRIGELSVPEVARILNIAPGMVRRLVGDGYLDPVTRHKGRGSRFFFQRGQVEDLLQIMPRLKEKWEADRARGQKNKTGKRKPRRDKEVAKPDPDQPIILDKFQEEAIKALDEGMSVLVAAPTGTGKTVIAEKVVEKCLAENRDVIYTSPIKALSNQKFRDFAKLYGREKVGLITGDISINERSPLLVMTTEIFRNWCFSNPDWMSNISFVIFDEVHYLDDPHRGTVWEESIIFAPSHIKILGLSATVPNIYELADWMSEVRQYPVTVVEERQRAVPLVTKWVTSDGELLNEQEAKDIIEFETGEPERNYRKGYGAR